MLGIVWISLPYQGMFGCFQWIGHVDHLNTRENRKIAGKKAFRSDRYFPISAGVHPTHSIYWGPLPHTHTYIYIYIYTHLFSCLGLGVLRNIGTHRTYIYNHTHIYILVTFSYIYTCTHSYTSISKISATSQTWDEDHYIIRESCWYHIPCYIFLCSYTT